MFVELNEKSEQDRNQVKFKKRYELVKCKKENAKTKFEEREFKNHKLEEKLCIDPTNEDLYLQGSSASENEGKKHVYLKVNINICSEETKVAGDPNCATDSDIDDYIEGKYV